VRLIGFLLRAAKLEWRKAEQKCHARIGKAKAVLLVLRGYETGGCKRGKAVSFQISLCSDPHVWL